MSMSCCVMVNVLLRLTARPTYWRIAVILPGRILWRTYSRETYPTPDDAVWRCLAGLAESSHQQHEPCPRAAGQNRELTPAEGHQSSPFIHQKTRSRETTPKAQSMAVTASFSMCLPLPSGIQPQTGQCPEEGHHGHAEPQRGFPAVDGDEAMQHLRPLPPVRFRAAWWGWL